MSVLFGTLAVLGLIDHNVHAYTTVPDGFRRTANILEYVAVAMPGTIASLAQCLLFMKGSTIRFFGTAKACTGREVLMLIIGQVSGRTPITNNSIDPHTNNVKHRARARTHAIGCTCAHASTAHVLAHTAHTPC